MVHGNGKIGKDDEKNPLKIQRPRQHELSGVREVKKDQLWSISNMPQRSLTYVPPVQSDEPP